eukprot:3047415-Rhodomonas_salina.1
MCLRRWAETGSGRQDVRCLQLRDRTVGAHALQVRSSTGTWTSMTAGPVHVILLDFGACCFAHSDVCEIVVPAARMPTLEWIRWK